MPYPHDYDTLLGRLIVLLLRLYEGRSLSVKELAQEFGVHERTIKRDFSRLGAHLSLENKKGHFRLASLETLNEEERLVVDTLHKVSESISPQFAAKARKVLSRLQTSLEAPIYARVPLEDISSAEHTALIGLLEHAIRTRQCVTFFYGHKHYTLQPLRILSFDGYWYLCGTDHNDGSFKKFYLKGITEAVEQPIQFKWDKRMEALDRALDSAINVWFEPEASRIEVVLLASGTISHYFTRKPISPTQRIVRTFGDNSMEIALSITHENELLGLVKFWLPHIRVIEPAALQRKIEDDLRAYLA